MLLLGRRQQRQLIDTGLRIGNDAVQQVQPVLRHARHGVRTEQVGGIGQGRRQAVGGLEGIQGQVELRGRVVPAQAFDRQARHLQRLQAVTLRALVIEHDLEQRAETQAALRLQGLDQLLERQVLMLLGAQRHLPHLRQHLTETRLPGKARLHHLGVDEEADQAFGFHPVAVGHRHPDRDQRLTAVAVQQALERSQQQHEQGDVMGFRQLLQALRQCRIQLHVELGTAKALLGRADEVVRQLQQAVRLAQLRGPPGQLAGVLALLQPVALPVGIVGVLDRQRRQGGFLALAVTGVEPHQLVDHQLHRPAIGDDVMLDQQQDVLVAVQLQQTQAYQRPLLQVKQLRRLGFDPAPYLGFAAVLRVVQAQRHAQTGLD
ncbi:hypothetical protein D3C79_712730 [compost metagenome]